MRRLVATLALLAALASYPLTAAPLPGPEKLLPDDTLIMMTVPDFARLQDLTKNSPERLLWSDPAMKPFKDKFLTKWREEVVTPLERELGVRFDDYTSLPKGQVTVAMTQNGWQAGGDSLPALLLLLDAGDRSGQLKTNLATLKKKWVDAGKPIRTEKIRNVEFSIVTLSTNDIPGTFRKLMPEDKENAEEKPDSRPALKRELAVGQYESLLILGTSTKAIEKVVVHLTGGATPALADVADFEANRLALFRGAITYGWVNLKTFISMLTQASGAKDDEDASGPFAMFKPDKLIAASGLGGLKTFAFAFLEYTNDGATAQVLLGIPESARQGVFKVFTGENRDSTPPAFVPADVSKFQRFRVDGQKAWAALEKMLNDISPEAGGLITMMIERINMQAREKNPEFDLRKNLIGNLGDDVVVYERAPKGATLMELSSAPSLVLVGSPRPSGLADALKALLSMGGGTPTEREFLGRKIYSVPLPGLPVPMSASPSQRGTLSYTATSAYLAVSKDAALLEEYLRSSDSPPKPLRGAPGMTEAIAKAGGGNTGWLGYENHVETMRMLVEALRKTSDPSDSSAELFQLPGMEQVKDWLDFSLLPPFEKISKYFHYSVYTCAANKDGYALKIYSPTPPNLRK